jgi:hypothetical protein
MLLLISMHLGVSGYLFGLSLHIFATNTSDSQNHKISPISPRPTFDTSLTSPSHYHTCSALTPWIPYC